MSKIEEYLARTGHYPTFKRPKRELYVQVAPGYIQIKRRYQDIYIPKSDLIPLLRWLIPLVKYMGEDFDPEAAIRKYAEEETELRRGLREQKKTRSRVPRHLR